MARAVRVRQAGLPPPPRLSGAGGAPFPLAPAPRAVSVGAAYVSSLSGGRHVRSAVAAQPPFPGGRGEPFCGRTRRQPTPGVRRESRGPEVRFASPPSVLRAGLRGRGRDEPVTRGPPALGGGRSVRSPRERRPSAGARSPGRESSQPRKVRGRASPARCVCRFSLKMDPKWRIPWAVKSLRVLTDVVFPGVSGLAVPHPSLRFAPFPRLPLSSPARDFSPTSGTIPPHPPPVA